jgi:hypothetical protein
MTLPMAVYEEHVFYLIAEFAGEDHGEEKVLKT